MKDNEQKQYLNNQEKIDKMNNQANISFNNDSEIIIMKIVNKIILNAFYISRKKEINEKLKIYCNDFIMDKIFMMVNNQFLNYDTDLELKGEKIILDNRQEKDDKESILFPEPLNPEKDRNSSNMIRLIFDKSNSFSSVINSRGSLQKRSLTNIRIAEESNEQLTNKLDSLTKTENTSSEIQKIVSRGEIIYSLPCMDLEEKKYSNIYMQQNKSLEFDALRKEKELELKRKKIEIQLSQKNIVPKEKEQKSLLNLKKKIKKIEYFDMKKIGFDSQGNIIKKIIYPADSLAKDFSFLKLMVSKEIKKVKIKKKLDSEEKRNNITTTNFRKITNEINPFKINNRDLLSGKKTTMNKVEYNPKDTLELYQNTKYSKYKELDKNAFLFNNTSANNLSPEPGVIFKTKIMKKIGGKNFYKKYNRPSMMEFNNFILNMSNSIPNSSRDMIKSSDSTNIGLNSNEKINEISEIVKYNGCNENFEENNPLIKDANKMNSKPEDSNKKIINKKYLKRIINLHKIDRNKESYLSQNYIKNLKLGINQLTNSMRFCDNIQLSQKNNFDNLYNYLSERNTFKNFDFTNETTNELDKNYKNYSMKNLLKNECKDKLKYKKLFFPLIKDKINDKTDINNKRQPPNSMEKFNKNIIKEVNFDIWGNYSEPIKDKDKENLSSINNNIKPFSLYKKLNISKISNQRERKNIVDIIKKKNKLKFERYYNFSAKNKKLFSDN